MKNGTSLLEALHLEESLPAEHREQVLLLLGQFDAVHAHTACRAGKKRMSLGVRADSTSQTRVDSTAWRMSAVLGQQARLDEHPKHIGAKLAQRWSP